MSYDTFTPPQLPSVNGTTLNEVGRVITSDFGDGYKQDTPDGLNNWVGALQLTWSPIAYADATTIRNFFKAHNGQWFYYTPPRETVPRLWICKSVTRGYPWPAQDSINVNLEERFSL